jgi:hypothetical protein
VEPCNWIAANRPHKKHRTVRIQRQHAFPVFRTIFESPRHRAAFRPNSTLRLGINPGQARRLSLTTVETELNERRQHAHEVRKNNEKEEKTAQRKTERALDEPPPDDKKKS